jgi:genome maintenance exonuclease 1|tara:strand:- start:742 stop:1434 length:693 start_codon:yes stop_codon:yes gene_type:complete
MKWNKLYDYPRCVRSLVEGKRKYEVAGERLPSVTTILKNTESEDKKESLARWKAKVGEVEAERVKNVAATRGTAMHTYLEHYVKGGNVLDLTDVGREASGMGETIIEKGFPDLEEVWGVECTLHYPGLYAGQTDLCGIYQGRESIIDFKQSNKPKKAEWIDDYKLQLVAYAMAHDQIYGTRIEQGVILMCTPDNFFQRFLVNGSEFREWKWEWLKKIDQYYGKKITNEGA